MNQIQRKELKIGIVIKAIAIVASIYGMFRSFENWQFFTYFTNLSNIYIDVMLGIFLVGDVIRLKKNSLVERSNFNYRMKFLGTISITLTFLVFLLILAPSAKDGFWAAYFNKGWGSICVHFINPLLAIIDYCLFDYNFKSTKKDAFWGVVPPLCYVVVIVILSLFGVRWKSGMSAPYNFLNFGADTGWFGLDLSKMSSTTLGIGVFYMIVVLVAIFIGLGFLFLFIKNKRYRGKVSSGK